MRRALGSSDREILRLALPAMAALAADPLLSLVDTALVGRLGVTQLAALGIDVAVFTTVFFGFNFLTYGTTAAVARLRGAGDDERAASYALQALWLALGLGIVVTAVLLAGRVGILRAMGASGDVVAPAVAYLQVRALGAVPLLVSQVGHGIFRGLKDTRTPLLVSIVVNVVNGAVSWVLIYPLGYGVAGAAAGTVLAETLAAVILLGLARRRLPTPSARIDPVAMREMVRVSWNLFLRTAALLCGLLITTAVAARMGAVTVAAHQIARELWSMLALVLDGFAIAAQAMIGTALGAGRSQLARTEARRLVWWGLGAGVFIAFGYLALAGPLPRIFTADEGALEQVGDVWLIVALLQPIGGIVFVLDGVLMGAGDFRFLFWSTAAAALGALLPVALLALRFDWGLRGIWAGMGALMLVRLGATLWRLRDGRWARVGPSSARAVPAAG
ncbi:MAG: MATE family efflux transporter [Euzebyaceae bacterium]|nr:MATE family efflux transporter [Euzebyaceae bacterium]